MQKRIGDLKRGDAFRTRLTNRLGTVMHVGRYAVDVVIQPLAPEGLGEDAIYHNDVIVDEVKQ